MRKLRFKEVAEKSKKKELVIIRDGKAISSHFPCSLIKNEHLTLKYITAVDEPKKPVLPKRKGPSGELLMFHVLVKGGRNVVNIMRNPALKKVVQEITVYAYKGEKVKHALKRDGRFLDVIFKKTCELSHKSTEVTTDMSNPVDDLDGEIFQITLFSKSAPPDSQPDSLDDAYVMQNEAQIPDSVGNQGPSQLSTTTESGNDNEIHNSKKMQRHLSLQVKVVVKEMSTKQVSKMSGIQNLFREEYGKNAQTCSEVKTLKKLMELSNSVCHVRINGRPEGSGFLLFDKFVLTNGHVIEKALHLSTGQLVEKVTVHFSFESLDEMESGAEVEEVAGFEHYSDESGYQYDWALLRLGADLSLPNCLLTYFQFLPPSGGICIIGHPDGGVKKIDPCLIIPTDNRNQVAERHRQENPEDVLVENDGRIQWVTPRFFEDVAKHVQQKKLAYESCFYFGSSGSPVFDEHCNVVAIHSGGYVYENARGERHSVFEYGYRLSDIIEHIIVHIVRRGRFDVLKKYLSCDYAQHQNLMISLKTLVESRNLPAFRNAVNNPVVTSDESLTKFFKFLTHTQEPVPMDTD